MMKKFNVEFSAEINVELHTPEKTAEYFIEGDWKDTFFTFVDLDELAQHLAYNFRGEHTMYIEELKEGVIFIEGFPYFRKGERDTYYFDDPQCGKVVIYTAKELDIDFCTEIGSE